MAGEKNKRKIPAQSNLDLPCLSLSLYFLFSSFFKFALPHCCWESCSAQVAVLAERGVFCSLGVDGSGSGNKARNESISEGGTTKGSRDAVGTQDFRDSGGSFGEAGGKSHVRLFGWRQQDFASSQMMLRQLWCCLVSARSRAGGAQHLSVISAVTWGEKHPLDDTRVSLNPPCPWALLLQQFSGQAGSFGFSSPLPFPPPLPGS